MWVPPRRTGMRVAAGRRRIPPSAKPVVMPMPGQATPMPVSGRMSGGAGRAGEDAGVTDTRSAAGAGDVRAAGAAAAAGAGDAGAVGGGGTAAGAGDVRAAGDAAAAGAGDVRAAGDAAAAGAGDAPAGH